jgi:circadian clock protein KaiC
MRSIGLDLEPWVQQGLLKFHAVRPTFYGLEMHLAMINKLTNEFQPQAAVMDPITNLSIVAKASEGKSILMRLVDFYKNGQITTVFTNLTHPGELEETSTGVSSLMDTWLLVLNVEGNGERNRVFHVLKSRGTAHSNQMREFIISHSGIDLVDAYVGPGGVLTGSARTQQEGLEKAAALAAREELGRRRRNLERKRQAKEAQVAVMQLEIGTEEEELKKMLAQEEQRQTQLAAERTELANLRKANGDTKEQ